MNINLATLSFEELTSLLQSIDMEVKSRKQSEVSALLETIKQKAESLGMNVEDISSLLNKKGTGKPAKVSAAKYANPADRSQTWTGKGRKPKWFEAAIASGKKESDLAI